METMNWKTTPSDDGFILDPHQIEGVNFLNNRAYAILADDPRLGKTAQAVRAADRAGCRKILVICPAIAREHWRHEFESWQLADRNVAVYSYEKLAPHVSVKHPHVFIVSFGALSISENNAVARSLRAHPGFDLLIVDECHRLKNPESNRTKRVYGSSIQKLVPPNKGGLAGKSARVWILTGTPAPNHAGELYSHLRTLFPETITIKSPETGVLRPMRWDEYRDRYCRSFQHPKFGETIRGSKNLKELREKIRPHLLRRRETDVKDFLPDLRVTVENLDPAFVKSLRLIHDANETLSGLISSLPLTIPDLGQAIETEKGKSKAPNIQRIIGVYKTPAVFEWVTNLMDDGTKKLILFCIHHDVIDRLTALLNKYQPVKVDGRDPDKVAQERIAEFQTNPRCQIFIGQVQSCGEAICLDAAARVAFAETPWVPYQVYQAANRARSRKSKNKILAQLLTVPGTQDARVLDAIRRKVDEINTLFG